MSTSPLRPIAFLLGALLALVVPQLDAQEPGEALCGRCRTTGRQPFDIDRSLEVEQDYGTGWEVEYCSDAIQSKNMGLDWMVCPRCRTPSVQAVAQADWDAIAEDNHAWLEERQRMERYAKFSEVIYVETTHFVVSWNLPKVKIDKKTYRMHEAAHLFARRFEEFYADFQGQTSVNDVDNMRNKHHMFLFAEAKQAVAVGPPYAGLTHAGTVKRAGGVDRESVIVSWRQKSMHPTDEDFLRHLVHNLVHQLTSVYRNTAWFTPDDLGLVPPWLNDDYGWLDAGLAHWFERREPGGSETYCFREQDANARWGSSDWHDNVWKAVNDGDWPAFSLLISKPTQSLTAREHQFCWSWVDFLMDRKPMGMAQAIRLAKEEEPTRDILRVVFRLSMLSFEEDWAEWVRTEYAPSKREGGGGPRGGNARFGEQTAPQRR